MRMDLQRRSIDRYQGIQPSHIIGSGAYGVVYKVKDRYTNETYAIKQFVDENWDHANQSITLSATGIPYYIIREVSVLRELQHENIVTLKDCVFDDLTGALSLVFEYLDTDLHKFIQDYRGIVPPRTVQSLIQQCLKGVACCHESGILHRDLKPANLLVSVSGRLKVADFGLARVCASPQRRLTQEVVTLWYRAPEILLGSRLYGFAADVWSIGLIFIEMIVKYPLFRTKHLAEIEVLFKIFQFLGTPSEATWPRVTQLPDWCHEFPRWKKRAVDPFLKKNLDKRGLDLLYHMLTPDPAKRITAQQALAHPYFE